MNILHNLDNSNLGGIQELIFNLHKFSRHSHHFWAADGSMAPLMRAGGMVLWPGGPPPDAHYDVVVGHGVGGWSYNDVANWSHARGAKFVEVMHSPARSLTNPTLVDGFIGLNNTARDLNSHMPRATRIYALVNQGQFTHRHPVYIGRMSRLVAEKKPWEFAQLAAQFPNEQFVMAGDGPEAHRLHGSNLTLVGLVRDFGTFFGHLKLFVYPTRDECCCTTVAMAQMAGVPVICQDIPALRETTGGFATFCNSQSEFERAVDDYLLHSWEYENRAVDALHWAQMTFSETVISGEWDRYLETL